MLAPAVDTDRRKAPPKLRSALLDATAAIIADQGLARVTVDAVARAAGVTKGGLFHHFPSKQALIDGVLDTMLENVDGTVDGLMADDPEPYGRFTRALLHGVFADRSVPGVASSRTLCLAMLADPVLQRRWASWIADRIVRHADTDDNLRCAIVRLAIDGVWLSSLQNVDAAPPIPDSVKHALTAMTYASP